MNNISFVIVSCYKYSDLWDVMMTSIKKYWPSIYLRTFILTDSVGEFRDKYNFIVNEEDLSWSDNLIYLCEHLENKFEYVFLMMEDAPLTDIVDEVKINNYFRKFIEINGTFLTLLNEPYPSSNSFNGFQKISSNSPYRPTATFSLWNLSKLRKLLIKGESAWEFEKAGARRSEHDSNYFSFTSNQIKFIHMVVKGKLFPNIKQKLAFYGLMYDGPRSELPRLDYIKMVMYKNLRSIILKVTPPRLRKYWIKK